MQVSNVNNEINIKSSFYFIVLLLGIAISEIIEEFLPATKWGQFHALTEIACIAIAISIFLVTWNSYEENEFQVNVIGFGFLMTAILTIFHTLFSETIYPYVQIDLSGRFWIISRFVEALTFLWATSNFKLKIKWNKCITLGLTILIPLFITFFLTKFPEYFPIIRTEAGVTPIKIVLEIVVIAIFLLSILNITRANKKQEKISYNFVLTALMLAVPAEACFALLKDLYSLPFTLGHILKLTYYYFLYRGIFVSIIDYPYKKMIAAKKYYKNILNDLPIGIITFDKKEKISFINSHAENLLEFNEVLGLSAEEVACSFEDANLEDIRDSQNLSNIVLTKNNSRGSLTKIKLDVHNLPSGEALCLVKDAKKEQELKNLQLQTQTILNAISNPIVMVGKDKKIVMCNNAYCDYFEIDKKDVIAKDMAEFQKELHKRKGANIKEKQANGQNKVYEAYFSTKSGVKKEFIIHTSPILDIDGEQIGTVGIAYDITVMKTEQIKLQQQEKLAMLGQMAAGIVHEIRNPLTTIRGFSQIIKTKAESEIVKEYASIIETATSDANKVVTDFLAFAKPQPPRFKKVYVNDVVKSMNLMLDSHSFLKGVEINLKLVDNKKLVMLDESQFKQVILNIVKNAIEAMERVDSPRLDIETSYDDNLNEITISIIDNGKGMQLEDKIKVGSPFFTTKDKGTGLGLSICYQIINEHGGRIEFESESEKGTSFKIILPCAE